MTLIAIVLMSFFVWAMLLYMDTVEVKKIIPDKYDRCFDCGKKMDGEGYCLLDGSDRVICPSCYKSDPHYKKE